MDSTRRPLGIGGLEAIPRLLEVAPEAKVIILTIHDDEAYFFRALQAGAAGYILKGTSRNELLAALRLVIHGGVPIPRKLGPRLVNDYLERAENGGAPSYQQFSAREREVLRLIAKRLSISARTVERHRSSIMNKLGLQNRAELVAYAVQQGLLSGGEPK